MSRSTLSFGIEVEVLVATLPLGHPHPNAMETRTVSFPREPNAQTLVVPVEATHEDVIYHVSQTLLAAGLQVLAPVLPTHDPDSDFTVWSVDRDASVGQLEVERTRNGYQSVGIEVRSPAYFYNANSLKEIGYVMGVLTSKYVLSVNSTTGLHVHVGNGTESFHFDTMRRLLAFLWAFEPQISTLHPPQRFNDGWAGSLRYVSAFSQSCHDTYGRLPRPMEGVAHFLKSKNWQELLADCASGIGRIPRLAYRFPDLPQFHEDRINPNLKLTVEFRQHAGTVDGEEIKHWVRTTVGIVGFIIDSDARALRDLFSIIAAETFDGENGETIEPVLAETDFTIIDLLRHMNLNIPAAYYQQRGMYKIRIGVDGEVVNVDSPASPGHNSKAGRDTQEQCRLREEMEAQNRAFYSAPTMGDPPSNSPYSPWIQDLRSALAAEEDNGEQKEKRKQHEAPKRLRSSDWRRSQPTTSNTYNAPSFSQSRGESSKAQASTTCSFLTDDMQDVSELLTDEVIKKDDERDTLTLAARQLEETAREKDEE